MMRDFVDNDLCCVLSHCAIDGCNAAEWGSMAQGYQDKGEKWTIISTRGRNWITNIPTVIAKALDLPTPELYTGHLLRRISAQWQADAGATVLKLQGHFS